MSITHEELASFNQFAADVLDDGGANLSLDEVFGLWRLENPCPSERHAVNAVIRQGIADIEAGRGCDAEVVSEELRLKHGVPIE